MTNPPRLRFSIVIVTHDGLHHLQPCLEALGPQLSPEWEVVVVDNGSSDGTRPFLEARPRRWLRPLYLSANTGFAAGNNRGAASARGDWLFLLNNDTLCAPGTLEALSGAVRRYPLFRIFSCRMVRASDGRIDNLGIRYSRLLRGVQIGSGAAAGWSEPAEVFGASGGAMLVNRTVIDDIGLFDEALFAYQEDVDFAVRARLAGYRCLHLPGAVVRHHGGGTSLRNPSQFRYLNQRNMELILRNLPRRVLAKYALPHLAYCLYQVLVWSWRGDGMTVLRAKLDGLAALLPETRRSRPGRITPQQFEASLHLRPRTAIDCN